MFRITADTIAANTGESSADAEVLLLVRTIEDRINEAVGHKQCTVEVQLPLLFESLTELNVAQAQTLVYGRLLQELDTAGLQAQLMITQTHSTVKVQWRPALGPQLERELKAVIKEHLQPLPAGNGAPAPAARRAGSTAGSRR